MPDVICHCGTVEEATRVAEKLFVQMTGADCPVWTFQVAVALRTICIDALADGQPLTKKDMAEAANHVLGEVRKHVRPGADLMTEAQARRRELHGE